MTFNCQSHHFLKSTWAKIENDDTPKTEIGPPKKRPTKKKTNLHTLLVLEKEKRQQTNTTSTTDLQI